MEGVNCQAEERGNGWQLTVEATKWQCEKLWNLPLDALCIGGFYPCKVGGIEPREGSQDDDGGQVQEREDEGLRKKARAMGTSPYMQDPRAA